MLIIESFVVLFIRIFRNKTRLALTTSFIDKIEFRHEFANNLIK